MGAWLFWGFVLAVLLGTAAEAQEKFERLGTFIGQGAPLGALVGPGPNGSERFYVAHSYASSMDVVAYEPDTGRYRVWRNPEGGAWAMENGPDGRVYIGTYYNGHILRLDPEAGTLDDLGQAIKGETYVWELSLGPDGKLYGCTNPNAKLLQLDPATGKVTDLGRMDATQNYNRHVFAAADGWVYCGIGTERGNLVAYHPRTRERRSLIPESERGPGTARITARPGRPRLRHPRRQALPPPGRAATPVATLPPKAPRTRLKDGRTARRRSQAYPGREPGLLSAWAPARTARSMANCTCPSTCCDTTRERRARQPGPDRRRRGLFLLPRTASSTSRPTPARPCRSTTPPRLFSRGPRAPATPPSTVRSPPNRTAPSTWCSAATARSTSPACPPTATTAALWPGTTQDRRPGARRRPGQGPEH